MKQFVFTVFYIFLHLTVFSGCGTNTDQPAFPLFSIVTPVSPPAITSVTAVSAATDDNPTRYEFDLQYFVTNRESNFKGYNLYIASSAIASNGSLVAISGSPYLETGVAPSFSHSSSDASTLNADKITQRIENFTPAPSPTSFQFCEFYYFRLVAVVENGVESNSSPQVQICAAEDIALCPTETPCNP